MWWRNRLPPKKCWCSLGLTTPETNFSNSTFIFVGCLRGVARCSIRTQRKGTSWSAKRSRSWRRWFTRSIPIRRLKSLRSWWTVPSSMVTRTWFDSCLKSTPKNSKCSRIRQWSNLCSKPWVRAITWQKSNWLQSRTSADRPNSNKNNLTRCHR